MSKLSFRARALDASKPMPIYLAEDLPDLPDYSAINRAVPQMPSGMEKEEECEHHLQRAICTGLIIPTPEVTETADLDFYQRNYPADYKMPRQLIHMQPLCLEQEVPEYDIDSEDELWLKKQRHAELTELKFEEMMDKLEKSSGQTVVTLNEAKLLLGRQDDLVVAVYDYWLNKRLKTQHPLILSVRTEQRAGQPANNPYLAFRRRTEKMQTRKNRKNDESSYEKMLKLRRELERAASLLQLVAQREQAKRDFVRITAAVNQARLKARDYTGHLCAELTPIAVTPTPPVVPQPLLSLSAYRRDANAAATHYADPPRQREKRQYKRRKHRHISTSTSQNVVKAEVAQYSSSESESGTANGGARTPIDDGPFAFRRKHGVYYQMPTSSLDGGYEDPAEKDKRFRFTLASVSSPRPRCVGFARRRMGRGGRVLLDRITTPLDDLWRHLPYRFPNSTTFNADERLTARQLDKWNAEPVAAKRDYDADAKHPWRGVFRKHLKRKPAFWTSDCVKSERDISLSDFKKRRLSSDEESLAPEERCFDEFVNELNNEWLHFRPKTPPPPPVSSDQDDFELTPPSGKTLFTRSTPLDVQLRLGAPMDDEPPSNALFKDVTSPFATGFTLSDIYGEVESPVQDDPSLVDSFGLTDSLQVDSILSEADLKALTEEEKDGKKNVVDLLRPEIADAILEELAVTPSFLCRGAGERRAVPAPNNRSPSKDDLGSTSVRVTDAPCEPIHLESGCESVAEEKPKATPPPPTPALKSVQPQRRPPPPPVPPPPAVVHEAVKAEKKADVFVPAKAFQQAPTLLKSSPSTNNAATIAPSALPVASSVSQPQARKPPQLLTVAVSEALKVRLQSHLLAGLDAPAVVGLVQNGPPYATAVSGGDGVTNATVARRANVTAAAPGTTRAVKLVQRLPAVVSLSGGNTRPHYIEIKGGQLSKGAALVNVVRHHHHAPQPRQPAAAPRAARLALALPRPAIQLHPTAALPGSVVAELLQKNAAGRGGARLALSGAAPAVQALYAARRRPANAETANSTTTPASAESSSGESAGGDVRRLEVT